jgi:hypothetical protein
MKRSSGLPCAYWPRTFGDPPPLRTDTRTLRSKINDSPFDREGGSSSCLPRWIAKVTPGGTCRTAMRIGSSVSMSLCRRAARRRQLDRRALVSAVRTEYAAVARHRTQQNSAASAVEEIHASVRGHALHRRMPAFRACQERRRLNGRCHFAATVDAVRACRRLCTSRAKTSLSSFGSFVPSSFQS